MKHTKCYRAGHPRPQLVREDWLDLNGNWKFAFGEEVTLESALMGELPRTINVPFSYETQKSGIGIEEQHAVVWYARKIAGKKGKRAILHFEGADYLTEVYLNGNYLGSHRGGYSRFSFDVTEHLDGREGLLAVKCTDRALPSQVRGKQRWEEKSFGCWYVQTTGIWKSVWMEYVNEQHITSLKITPSVKETSVTFDVSVSRPSERARVRFAISFQGKPVQEVSVTACEEDCSVTASLMSHNLTYQAALWSPDSPDLYDVDITLEEEGKAVDSAGSYFGLREYTASEGKLLLNHHPFYARMLLDQGYWKESGLTPPDEEALVKDIVLAKEMGFNGVRKHQKVEDERFFYYADILGLTVWCELPSNHWFSDRTSRAITEEWMEIVAKNYNHPSLVTWVLFNESWGVRSVYRNERQQSFLTALYHLTKAFDPMRPVITNDGWLHTVSDILTLHHYEQDGRKLLAMYATEQRLREGAADLLAFPPFALGNSYRGQPIILSEFGGTAFVRDVDRGWGYGNGVGGEEEFLSRFGALIKAVEEMHISGYCYTQLTDVEHEVNGLLYADRTPKVPLEEIAKRNL